MNRINYAWMSSCVFFRQLPSDLLTVVNHLNSILGVDSRLAEVNLTILAAYGHPAPFKSKRSYQIWVCVLTMYDFS